MLSTQGLASASARHPWRTIGARTAVFVLAIVVIATLLGGSLTTEGEPTNNPESLRARDAQAAAFPPDPGTTVTDIVVVRSDEHTVDSPQFESFVRQLVEGSDTVALGQARTYLDDPESLVSEDRHATIVPIGIVDEDETEAIVETVERADENPSFSVAVTGDETLDHDFNLLSQEDLENGELRFGLPAALLVLLLVFGAVVAGLVPLLMAAVSIVVALGLTALVAQPFELSVFVINMLTGMGLALGIDYSLFVVSRYREERTRGREQLDAIAASGLTASRAVLFSGTVFVVAMLGMLIVPSSIMRSLAVGAILVGIVSVVAALTLLPAVLGRRPRRCHGAAARDQHRHRRRVDPSRPLRLQAGLSRAPARLPGHDGRPGRDSRHPRRLERGGHKCPRGAPFEPRGGRDVRRRRDPACRGRRGRGARGSGRGRRLRPGGDRCRAGAPHRDGAGGVRGNGSRSARRWCVIGEHRLLRLGDRPGALRHRARAPADVPVPDGRLPLGRDRRHGRRPEPALRRSGVRAARARVPVRHRRRSPRVPGRGPDRGVGAAIPVLGALRALDGLPGVPAEPDPGALRRDPRHRRRGDLRRRLDCADHHWRRAHHRRGLRRLRAGRPDHVPADGVRRRRRAPDRRNDHPVRRPAELDEAPRRLELVPPALARVAAAAAGGRHPGRRGAVSCRSGESDRPLTRAIAAVR